MTLLSLVIGLGFCLFCIGKAIYWLFNGAFFGAFMWFVIAGFCRMIIPTGSSNDPKSNKFEA